MMKSKKINVALLDKYHIQIPEEVADPFTETKDKRAKFIAKFKQKEIEFYAALKKDKNTGDFRIMFSKEKQKQLGIFPTDEFEIQLFEDTSKYGVEMPEELDAVLMSDYDAYQIFESFTKGKQRSIIYGVIRFKTSQQKIDKALIMCENLKRGNHEPMKMFKL